MALKKETGQNLFSYIMKLKLTEAKQLLKTTDMTLDDIAFHLGFSNSKVLKKLWIFAQRVPESRRPVRFFQTSVH